MKAIFPINPTLTRLTTTYHLLSACLSGDGLAVLKAANLVCGQGFAGLSHRKPPIVLSNRPGFFPSCCQGYPIGSIPIRQVRKLSESEVTGP